MNKEEITNDFKLNRESTNKISKKYNLNIDKIKSILRNSLGDKEYLRIAHSIGGRVISERLKNPKYRKVYYEKMSKSVSSSINDKMKNEIFKQKWLSKSKKASIKGNNKIKLLLESDYEFRNKLRFNCKKGGEKIYKENKGIFDKKNLELRKQWSLKGLNNTKRKITGPQGELMYNDFERYIAKTIKENGIKYIYEKIYKVPNKNGFISCDFEIKINKDLYIIESTCWDKIEDKSEQMNNKFNLLKNKIEYFKYILVVPTKTYSDKYSEFLDSNILCLSSYEFKEKIKGIAGEGFEPSTSGL